MDEIIYSVPGMSCGHCEEAVKSGVGSLPGVTEVRVELQTKQVTVRGKQLDDGALRAAIDEAAGYDVAEASRAAFESRASRRS